MEDRFVRGFLAGLLAAVPLVIFNHVMYFLKITPIRYLNFAAVMIFGRMPTNLAESLFAWVNFVFFAAVLGSVFIYLRHYISDRYLLLKGAIFGGGLWFTFYSVAILFKIPELEGATLGTAVSNSLGAEIWGVSLAYAMLWLESRMEKEAEEAGDEQRGKSSLRFRLVSAPARKPEFKGDRPDQKSEDDDQKVIKLKHPIKLK